MALWATCVPDSLPSAWFTLQSFHGVSDSVPCLVHVLVFAYQPQSGACLWCPFCDLTHRCMDFSKILALCLLTSYFDSSRLDSNGSRLCSNQGCRRRASAFAVHGLCLVNKRRSASALEQTQDMSITANQEIQPLREAWVERESPKPQLGLVPACLSQLWHHGPVTHPYTVSCW